MDKPALHRNVALYRSLHPALLYAMVGSVIWTVVALWLLFDDGAGTTLSLAVVAFFALAFVGTPVALWLASPRAKEDRPKSLAVWLEGEFEADRGRLPAKDALAMVLLLPVASAAGLTAVSFVAWLAARGAL